MKDRSQLVHNRFRLNYEIRVIERLQPKLFLLDIKTIIIIPLQYFRKALKIYLVDEQMLMKLINIVFKFYIHVHTHTNIHTQTHTPYILCISSFTRIKDNKIK